MASMLGGMDGMEELVATPLAILQYGLALAVPAALAAIVQLGCGKKRNPPAGPHSSKSGKKLKRSASSKSKRSTKSASKKAGKAGGSVSSKSKRSVKSSGDKSGKSSKKSSKSSKKSSSKKSKSLANAPTATAIPLQPGDKVQHAGDKVAPSSTRTAIESEKRSFKEAAASAGAALARDVSGKAQQAQRSLEGTAADAAWSMQKPSDKSYGGTTRGSIVAVTGDSTRDLKMEPAELRWTSAGGMQKISLLNQSQERQAIKVKCSDNNVYRVNPVYAIVEPGQTLNVDVMRQNGSSKVDKIVFVTARAGSEDNAKGVFKQGVQHSMMVLPLLATSGTNNNNNTVMEKIQTAIGV